MNCDECRELMLEVDLEEVNVQGVTPLAKHLAACRECHQMSQGLLDSIAELSLAYAALPVQDAAMIASRASSQVSVAPSRHFQRIAAIVGVGVAAVLLLTVARPGQSPEESPIASPSVTDAQMAVEVEVPADRNAIVLTTKNPNISVVLIY